MDELDITVPSHTELVTELKALRRHGVLAQPKSRRVALDQAVRASGRVDQTEPVGPYAVERMLRDAVIKIGGDLGDAGATILGLSEESRGGRPPALRRLGAEALAVSVEHFRHHYEPLINDQLAHAVLAEIHDYRLRLSRLKLDVRTPVGSRLAVEWLARFEAMYAIWTPASGLGNDLTAYRSTLLEPGRSWDREPNPDISNDTGSTQESQAAGYVSDAFYHFAHFLLRLQDFGTKFGGMWLLPEAQAETDLADAAFRIIQASPNNERDDSRLRTLLRSVPNYELVGFQLSVQGDANAMPLLDEWHAWAATCECDWELEKRMGREKLPTHLNNPGISDQCDMHIMIAACNDYLLILDDAWDQIADWYHNVPRPGRVSLTAEQINTQRAHPLPGHLRPPPDV